MHSYTENPATLAACGVPELDIAAGKINPEYAPITIRLQGPPQGKGRARAFMRGGHIGHYTPDKTHTYEGMIRTSAAEAMAGRPALQQPVEFVLRAIFAVPASWSERKRQMAIAGDVRPGKKPDLDN